MPSHYLVLTWWWFVDSEASEFAPPRVVRAPGRDFSVERD